MKFNDRTKIRSRLNMGQAARSMAALVAALVAASALGAPSETAPIWKIQLRIRVADVANAGTDADIRVRLNTTNATWIDTNVNDFERNSNRLHYLLQTDVGTIANITELSIYHNNSDAICIRSLDLVVNGVSLYALDFGTNGRWLQNGTLTYQGSVMRTSTTWRNYATPALPGSMDFRTLENRIEAAFGHMMKGSKAKWDDGDVYALTPDHWSDAPRAIASNSPVWDFNPDGTFRRFIQPMLFKRAQAHTTGTRVFVTNKLVVDGELDKWCTTGFEVDMKIAGGRLVVTYHDMNTAISATSFEWQVWAFTSFVKQVVQMFTGGVVSKALDVIEYMAKSQYATKSVTASSDNSYVQVSFPVKPGATRVVKRKVSGEWRFVFE